MSKTPLIPRFKKGQKIQYNPASRVNFNPRPVWEIYEISEYRQVYYMRRFDGNQIRSRILPFAKQRRYWVEGLSFEEQP